MLLSSRLFVPCAQSLILLPGGCDDDEGELVDEEKLHTWPPFITCEHHFIKLFKHFTVRVPLTCMYVRNDDNLKRTGELRNVQVEFGF